MKMMLQVLLALVSGMSAACAAEGTPSARPETVQLLVPFGPKGVVSTLAFVLKDPLGEALGTKSVVQNMRGANGLIAGVAMNKMEGALLVATPSVISVPHTENTKLGFEPAKLTRLCGLGEFPIVLVVPAASSVMTIADLQNLSSAKKDGLNIGAGNDVMKLMKAEFFKRAHITGAVTIPYANDMGGVVTALIGGRLDAAFMSSETAYGLSRGGKLRVIAVASNAPVAAFPSAPTLASLLGSWPNTDGWVGVFGPAGMSEDMIRWYRAGIEKAKRSDAFAKILASHPLYDMGACETFDARVASSIGAWSDIAEAHSELFK